MYPSCLYVCLLCPQARLLYVELPRLSSVGHQLGPLTLWLYKADEGTRVIRQCLLVGDAVGYPGARIAAESVGEKGVQ